MKKKELIDELEKALSEVHIYSRMRSNWYRYSSACNQAEKALDKAREYRVSKIVENATKKKEE